MLSFQKVGQNPKKREFPFILSISFIAGADLAQGPFIPTGQMN